MTDQNMIDNLAKVNKETIADILFNKHPAALTRIDKLEAELKAIRDYNEKIYCEHQVLKKENEAVKESLTTLWEISGCKKTLAMIHKEAIAKGILMPIVVPTGEEKAKWPSLDS